MHSHEHSFFYQKEIPDRTKGFVLRTWCGTCGEMIYETVLQDNK